MGDSNDEPELALKSIRIAAKPRLSLKAPTPAKRPPSTGAPSLTSTKNPGGEGSTERAVTGDGTHHGAGSRRDPHDHHHHHHHNHDQAPERPTTTRAAEDGGAALQLDLAWFLPGERDDRGRFERWARELALVASVTRVHLRADAGFLQACVHHDGSRATDSLLEEVRTRAVAAGKRFATMTWFVRGMDSVQCGQVIEHVLQRTRGILQADVAYAAERLVVEYDTELQSVRAIEGRVRAVGYELEVPQAGHVCSIHGNKGGLAPKLELPLVVVAGILLFAGVVVDKTELLPAVMAQVLYGLALLSGGFFSTRSAVLAVRQGKIDIEALMVLAAVGAAGLGAFFEGAFLLFLFSLGHLLEHRAMDRARRAVEKLEELRPETAMLQQENAVVEVAIDDVEPGQVVLVRPGDRVPLDGVVVDGTSAVNQAALTGESMPVAKAAGDLVFAGTVNQDGSLSLRVTKRAKDSSLSRLVDLVASAEARKSKAQRFATRVEKFFVPLVLVAAPSLVFFLWATGTDFHSAVLRGLSLLVAASPCALAVSTPAAVLSAVAAAARNGVLIKGGAHLEALAGLQIVALDKTGTLTEGKPRVVDVYSLGIGDDALLALAASAEQLSSHPLAHAVVHAARERGLSLSPARDLQAFHGRGLQATVSGKQVRIGNALLFGGEPALPEALTSAVVRLQAVGQTTMIIEHEGVFVGVVGVMDTPRPAAAAALRALKKTGVTRTVMLSGDAEAVARAVGKSVGIDEVSAPCLPEDKVVAVKKLMREAPVGMVGDGVNDAPALAAASVGIAMGGAGSDVALETADVVLMGDDLMNLAWAIELSRAATRAVQQNITVALGVALVLVIASVGGFVAVSEAVVLHEGSTLLVVVNGLRLLLHKRT
jgi:Cd2+/Zn2+-exporting ATPase